MEKRTQGVSKMGWDDYCVFDLSKYHFAVMKQKTERYVLTGEIPNK